MVGVSTRSWFLSSAIALGATVATTASAQESLDQQRSRPTWEGATEQALSDGAFLPLSLTPSVAPSRGTVGGHGGYDGARESAVSESFVEVRPFGPVALRGGTTLSDTQERFSPWVGGRLQLLNQEEHEIDGGVGVFYKTEGFTEPEGEIEGVLSASRRFGRMLTVLNLAYGQDPEARERDGEARLGFLVRALRALHVGLDARYRFDLGSETEKLRESHEPRHDVDAGPVVDLEIGPLVLTVHGGVSAVWHVDQDPAVGAIGYGGLGSSF